MNWKKWMLGLKVGGAISALLLLVCAWVQYKSVQTEIQTLRSQIALLANVTEAQSATPPLQSEIEARVRQTELLSIELRGKFDAANSMLSSVFAFVALIFAFVAIPSLVGWYRSEKRATDAHDYALKSAQASEERATQAFSLAIVGETATQKRAAEVHEQFLSGSRETLDLVNATLTLAKEASERAAKIIERKAKETVEKLDKDCQALLERPSKDDRALIGTPKNRSKLRTVARQIDRFESGILLLEEVNLTPACMFIKGMNLHLDQQYEEAIKSWNDVAFSNDADEKLKCLAWYWTGYEQNNIGDFESAEQSFSNSLAHASGLKRYELERIRLESRFFNKSNPAKSLIRPFEDLLKNIEKEPPGDERDARQTRIRVTLANVLSQAGYELREVGKEDEARTMFELAKKQYKSVSGDKWATIGLAEMLYELGDRSEAITLFNTKIIEDAQKEYISRAEPRTKVLAKTVELICCVRDPEHSAQAENVERLVIQELGRVDEGLTVYSQIQKRNIMKEDFPADLQRIMSQLQRREP